jgi:hypothetical protein
MEKTFKRAIERVGEKIFMMSAVEILGRGLEQYQGHLEILFSLLNSGRPDPIKLRKNAIEFIL